MPARLLRWFLAAAALALAPLAPAAPTLQLDVPSTVDAGQVFVLALGARNDGPALNYSRIALALPPGLMLAAPPPADCLARFDPQDRRFVFEGALPAGWAARCRLQLVAAPDMSSDVTFQWQRFTPPAEYDAAQAATTIAHVAAPALFSAGGIGVTHAGAVVLALLAVWGALVLRSQWRDAGAPLWRRAGLPLALVACVGFLIQFAAMAWDDARTLREYRETTCQVIDGTIRSDTVSAGTRGGARDVAAESAHKPVLSLRYVAGGAERHALGFSTDSRLSYSAAELAPLMQALQQGQRLPCWYDPQAPGRVVVLRGFGGAYLFATFPLLVLAYIAWLARGAGPRRRRA